jgi:hypothetical protein
VIIWVSTNQIQTTTKSFFWRISKPHNSKFRMKFRVHPSWNLNLLDIIKLLIVDMWLKLKIVPDSWEYTGFWKFGPYWPQK